MLLSCRLKSWALCCAAAPPAAQEQGEQLPKVFDAEETQQRLYKWCASAAACLCSGPVHLTLITAS